MYSVHISTTCVRRPQLNFMKNQKTVIAQEESRPPRRSTYRHGDLYRALLEAGVELARTGGPDAVVLREVTRQAGVVPNAAYRHFADRQALLEAVCDAAQARLALAIETELAALPKKKDAVKAARGRLRAIGAAYIKFARAEPGLFRTAFSVPANLDGSASPAKAGSSGLSPFQHLSAALDALADVGALSAERRKGAEFLAWSAVHGLAILVLDGPLRHLDDAQTTAIGQRLLEMVEQGL